MIDRTIAPATYPFGRLELPEGRVIVHETGVKLHIFDGAADPICCITMVWPGGDMYGAFPGQTALALQAVREGSDTMTSAEVADCLDYNGARLTLMSAKYVSELKLTCANSRLAAVLPVVLSCVAAPAMPRRSIDVLIENAAMSVAVEERQVSARAQKASVIMTYGSDNPAARDVTPQMVRAQSREQLLALQQTVCATVHGLEIYVAGNVTDDVLSTLSACLNDFAAKAKGQRVSPEIFAMKPEAPGRREVKVEGAMQSGIVITMPAIYRDNPDYHALRTTVMALGGYFGSRLMSNIREEKGYTYGIQSALVCERGGAYISISSQQDVSYTEEVIRETMHEIERLRTELMPADELERLRGHAMSEVATVLDTPFRIADYRMTELTEGMPHDYYHRLQEQVRTISADIIREMARKYIDPSQARIAVATC